MKKNFNVILSISCSVTVTAENESEAMEKVSSRIASGDSGMIDIVRNATEYSLYHNDCIEVTDAVEIDECSEKYYIRVFESTEQFVVTDVCGTTAMWKKSDKPKLFTKNIARAIAHNLLLNGYSAMAVRFDEENEK